MKKSHEYALFLESMENIRSAWDRNDIRSFFGALQDVDRLFITKVQNVVNQKHITYVYDLETHNLDAKIACVETKLKRLMELEEQVSLRSHGMSEKWRKLDEINNHT